MAVCLVFSSRVAAVLSVPVRTRRSDLLARISRRGIGAEEVRDEAARWVRTAGNSLCLGEVPVSATKIR